MSLNPAKFPLYRLSVLPFQEVIKSMELDVMFFFSLTSLKAQKKLNFSLLKNYLHLDCNLGYFERITVEYPSSNNKFVLDFKNTVPNGGGSFQLQNVQFRYFRDRNQKVEICGEESLAIMVRELITHLAKSLHLPKISMVFQNVVEPQTALEFLNHVKNLSLTMVRIELITLNTPAKIYKAFLDEGCRILKSLIMGCRGPAGFQYTLSEDFHLEKLEVHDGYWAKFEDYIHCRHVMIRSIAETHCVYSVNPQSLNQFFKVWQKSSYRLECLILSVYHSHGLNFEDITMGLNGTNITRDQFESSIDIERQDGKKATITLSELFARLEIKS